MKSGSRIRLTPIGSRIQEKKPAMAQVVSQDQFLTFQSAHRRKLPLPRREMPSDSSQDHYWHSFSIFHAGIKDLSCLQAKSKPIGWASVLYRRMGAESTKEATRIGQFRVKMSKVRKARL